MPRKPGTPARVDGIPSGLTTVKCATCGTPVNTSGWCAQCSAWAPNCSPRRTCNQGHPSVEASGYCFSCKDFVATRIDFTDGKWVDTHRTDKRLDKRTNQERMRFLMDCLGRGDKAALIAWAKQRAAEQPGIGWEQAISELLEDQREVPF